MKKLQNLYDIKEYIFFQVTDKHITGSNILSLCERCGLCMFVRMITACYHGNIPPSTPWKCESKPMGVYECGVFWHRCSTFNASLKCLVGIRDFVLYIIMSFFDILYRLNHYSMLKLDIRTQYLMCLSYSFLEQYHVFPTGVVFIITILFKKKFFYLQQHA